MERTSDSKRPLEAMAAGMAALVLFGAAGAALYTTIHQNSARSEAAEAEDRLALVAVESELSWLHLDFIAGSLDELIDDPDAPEPSTADLESEREHLLLALSALSRGSGESAREATIVTNEITAILQTTEPTDLAAAEIHFTTASSPPGVPTPESSLWDDRILLGLIPMRIYTDSASTELADRNVPVPPPGPRGSLTLTRP